MRAVTTLSIAYQCVYTNPLDNSVPIDDLQYTFARTLQSGLAPGYANRSWHARYEDVTGNTDIDLGGGTLDDGLGQPLVLETVRLVFIYNRSDYNLVVGNAAAQEWFAPFGGAGETVEVPPLSPCLLSNLVDGWVVDPGVADSLRVAAGAETVTFDIMVLGTHMAFTTTTVAPTTTTTPAP